MYNQYLLQNIWLITLLWVLVYLSDYYLTIYAARLFLGPFSDHIQIEGSYEITPAFQKDVDRLRLASPAFLLRVVLSVLLIPLLWWISVRVVNLPQFFLFGAGVLFLREAVVHLRHARNIGLALVARKSGGLSGQLTYARWLNLRISAVELFSFGLFFLILAPFAGFWFFLGGFTGCLMMGISHWRLSARHYPSAPAAGSAD